MKRTTSLLISSYVISVLIVLCFNINPMIPPILLYPYVLAIPSYFPLPVGWFNILLFIFTIALWITVFSIRNKQISMKTGFIFSITKYVILETFQIITFILELIKTSEEYLIWIAVLASAFSATFIFISEYLYFKENINDLKNSKQKENKES